MLQIRTVIVPSTLQGKFDNEVNDLIQEGWELVRRDVLPAFEGEFEIYPQRLYAELEREIAEAPETDDEDGDTDSADWEITRDPIKPFRCSKCGNKSSTQWPTCPSCQKPMKRVELL